MERAGESNAAFRQVFDDHFDALTRYCLRRLPRDDVNDAVARVFVIAWRKLDKMPEPDQVLPWLYRIAHYEVSTIRRGSRRLSALRGKLNGLAQPSSPGPDAIVVRRAEYETVVTALTLLSDKDREVILLRSYEDLPIAQIAVALGCNPEAAKKRLSRALDRLRKATGVIDTAPPTARPVRSNNGGDR